MYCMSQHVCGDQGTSPLLPSSGPDLAHQVVANTFTYEVTLLVLKHNFYNVKEAIEG